MWHLKRLCINSNTYMEYIVMEVHERDRGEMLIDGNEPPS